MSREQVSPPAAAAPRIFSNALATLVGRGLIVVVRFLATIVPAAYLSPESWGLFSLLVASVEVVRAITNFGLDTALVRWLTMHHAAAADVLRRVLLLKTWLAGAGFLGLAVYAFLRQEAIGPPWLLVLLSLGLFPFGWSQSLTGRFQAHHAMHRLIPVQVVVGCVYLATVLLTAKAGATLVAFIFLAVAYELSVCLGIWVVGRRALPSETAGVKSPRSTASLFWEGLPLGGLSLAAVIYGRLGVFFVEKTGTLTDVGHLFFAMKTSEQIALIGGPIAMSALPVFTRLISERSASQIVPIFRKYSLVGAAFSLVAALSVSLLARPLIEHFKPAYEPAVTPLVILCWAAGCMFQNHLSIGVVTAFGRFRLLFGTTMMNLVINVLLSIWFIPRLGVVGAALATLVTEAIHCIVQLTIVRLLLRDATSGSNSASPANASTEALS